MNATDSENHQDGEDKSEESEPKSLTRGDLLVELDSTDYEVEDALVNYATEQSRSTQLADALAQNKLVSTSFATATKTGWFLFSTCSTPNAPLSPAQTHSRNPIYLSAITDWVALYKALGGGWEKEEH
ncbi:MAG: hypothetical protein ABJC04_09425 [Verrucomicrobiota bacterium]